MTRAPAVTDFYLGFSVEAGRGAPVDVQTSASSRPIRLIFTSPRQARVGRGPKGRYATPPRGCGCRGCGW